MRLQPPDQLSTVLIWVAALFMAVKEGIEKWPAARDALPVMSAGWLNFVPLALLVVAAISTIARGGEQRPTSTPQPSLATPSTARENALTVIKEARDNAAVASSQGNFRTRMKAIHEVEAVMLTLKRDFGINPVVLNEPKEESACQAAVEFYLRFLDCIYPLLREGHDAEARAKADELISKIKA